VRRNALDNRLAREVLGWTPDYSLQEGLREVVASVKEML